MLRVNIVISPCGSTSLAILRASELARSALAGLTAKIRQLSLLINSNSMPLIMCSISGGWSPTATFVIPGKSIRVKLRTEKNNKQSYHVLTLCLLGDFSHFFVVCDFF